MVMLSNQADPDAVSLRRAESPPCPGKVSLMIGQLGLGGTEKQLVLLAQGLTNRGIDTNVLVMFEGGPHEDALRAAGVPVVYLGFRRFSSVRQIPRNVVAFIGLVRRLRSERPDVLHAFLLYSYLTAAPAARLARVKVLVAGRRSLGVFKQGRRVLLMVERLATRATDLLIANAQAVAEDTRKQERVPAAKISVVYNGLPDAAFAECLPARIETILPVVLCIANLKVYKGHRHLLEAIANLRDCGRPCTLVLVGDGDQRPALELQAAQLGIDVRFVGACVAVGPLLARADVVVSASLEEGMSNAVMEAMAAGRPIVATSVGGTPELLGGRGVLVLPGDPAALATAIESLLTDPALAARLGTLARQWSHAHLRAGSMIAEHIRIYSGLLER